VRLTAFALLILLSACGPPDTSSTTASSALDQGSDEGSDAWKDGIPGVYVLDASRNTADSMTDAEGKTHKISKKAIAQVQESLTDTRLEVKADNTWTLSSGSYETAGTWKTSEGGIAARTTTVGGEPAAAEYQVEETYGVERGYLLMQMAEQKLYLKKLKPE
jgi:hypothetical protein